MVLRYIGKLFSRASEGSVLLTDRLTILLVPFATLVLWAADAEMTTSLQETLLLGVAMTVSAVVVLRLVAASYFVWKDDQNAKAALQARLDAPERLAESAMKAFTIEARKELSTKLARLVSIAAMSNKMTKAIPEIEQDFLRDVLEIDTRINQLSYDVPLRIAAIRLRDYCMQIIAGEEADHDRLWKQRKLTFRILHKDDHISGLMSLMELEILIEDIEGKWSDEDSNTGADKTIKELKSVIRELGDNYYSRETRDALRDSIADKGFD